MKALIQYFAKRHLVTNLILFGVIFSAIGFWHKVGKEEFPDITMNWVRFSIPYPGAAAEDVELFVTKPIEEKLKELTGLYEVNATSSYGSASFVVRIESHVSNPDELIRDVKDAVDRTELPSETEDPIFRRFNTAEKAIIDIGLYHKKKKILDVDARQELQKFALAFESRALAIPEISGLDDQGYLQPEIQIHLDPKKLADRDLSLGEVRNQILAQHVRVPAGSMEDREESEVSFLSELDTVPRLENVIVRGGFEGQKIRLKEIGTVREGFEKNARVLKIHGHEGVLFNVKKSAGVDILTAQKAVFRFVEDLRESHPESPIGIVLLDDESYDIRNRLSLIGWNGLVGFILILLVLFLFLDFTSGFWVASGIPFTLAFTLLAALVMGFTINNVTLSGIIVVLGIVVDDAIVVAENISRLRRQGVAKLKAVVDGTRGVILPVLASILTTCAAFLPLFFFEGHFGLFIKYIPIVVFLMLGASLIEAMLILPGHLNYGFPLVNWWRRRTSRVVKDKTGHWFFRLEQRYANFLTQALRFRIPILGAFTALLVISFFLFQSQMKFVMFPREESKEIVVRAKVEEGSTRYETAKKIEPLEEIFLKDDHGVVVSMISSIGQNRRGGAVLEHEAMLRVELLPPSERDIPLNDLLPIWEKKASQLPQLKEVRFLKSRWGAESGSPIEFDVQENNDEIRRAVVEDVKRRMQKHPAISNVEIERPITRRQYELELRRDDVFTMGINPSEIGKSLRAFVEGQILYTLNKGEEEVDVRLTSSLADKKDIESILGMRVSNTEGYLVPYRDLVRMRETRAPSNIQRIDYRRTTKIYADLKENTDVTPLDVANFLEEEVFPAARKDHPSTLFSFRGEIEHSRESQGDFGLALVLSLSIIYFLLVLLYDSVGLPFLIGAVIPFGTVGVCLAFMAHGMTQYGFFAVVGTLGMIGVVVNDSIVMISKLEDAEILDTSKKDLFRSVADVSSTRLRAVVVTTLTTVAGLFPTAYGIFGYDSMLAEMMLAMAWGLIFSTLITLLLVPCLYSFYAHFRRKGHEAS